MKKKVFVAASLTGGRETLPAVRAIVDFFLKEVAGYEVLSAHNASEDPVRTFLEKIGNPNATDDNSFREYDYRWIEEAHLFVAEVSTPSHGVGTEFEHCRLKPRLGLPRTPSLCLYRENVKLSPMISGISKEEARYIWLRSYANISHMQLILGGFIEALEIEEFSI